MTTLRRSLFHRLQRFAGRHGVTMLDTWRVERLPQSRYLRRLFSTYDITGVIDVGANEGQYYEFLRREVGFEGPVVSVEPIPTLAAHLRQRSAASPHWHVEQMAMGAAPSDATFFVTAGSQFSSLLEPIAATQSIFHGQNAVTEALHVRVETLESLVRTHHRLLGPRIYLKLDTQGYDLEALRGLGAAVEHVIALQTESSVQPIYAGMPDYVESIRTVQALGYTLSQIFPNNEGHFPLLIEFDCHFVRLPPAERSVTRTVPLPMLPEEPVT